VRQFNTVKSAIREEDGIIVMTLGVSRDITERKQADHERERLIAELEEAVLFKDQFLATMSHELRTPLNAIQGFSGIAMMQDDVPSNILHMLERIKLNSRRLLSLINDVLDISRINAKRIEIVSRPVNLPILVNGWVLDFQQPIQDKQLAFKTEISSDLPATIFGDEERLTQITSNLLGNAIKFTDKGYIELGISASNDSLVIRVSDTGIGIPDSWQHLIFDEFRQVDGSSRRKHGGAGLGLSIVQKLCIFMGGSIAVTSVLNSGSTFTVTLPLVVSVGK
jgi:signal transduction histidine kinase